MSAATICLATLLGMTAASCMAQIGNPVLKIHAYERAVASGIPGGPPGTGVLAQQKQYSIYLETKPGAHLTVRGVWRKNGYYGVETAVRKAPVKFDNAVVYEQEERNLAVPATDNQVIEVIVKEALPGRNPPPKVAQLLRESQAVVQSSWNGQTVLTPVKEFAARDPLQLK